MKIGITGTGWGARVQVPAFRAAGLDVVAIAGSNAQKTRRLAGELSLEAHDDWRTLIDSNVDLVTIVTPPSLHREMAIAALRAGKHVISEKPTAMNANEAEEMVRASAEHPSQIALIDHELRFLPAWLHARARMQDVGAIRYVECRYSSPSRGDRYRPWSWWSDAEQGGGVLGAIGSHLIDAVRYFAGDITAVRASLQTFVTSRPEGDGARPVTSDDYADVELRLVNGARASLHMSVVAATDEPTTITIHGERGGFRFVQDELFVARNGLFERLDLGAEKPAGVLDTPGGAFATGTYFLGLALREALVEGRGEALAPGATFEDGLQQQRVLDAARQSNDRAGVWIAMQ